MRFAFVRPTILAGLLAIAIAAHASPPFATCPLPSASAAKKEDVKELREVFDKALKGDCCEPPIAEDVRPICLLRETKESRSSRPVERLTRQDVGWIWRWDAVVGKTGGAAELPNGFASALIASIDSRTRRDSRWLVTLLEMYRYADGVYAQEIAEKVVDLLRDKPSAFTSECPSVTQNIDLIERALELYPERRTVVQRTFRSAKGATQCNALVRTVG